MKYLPEHSVTSTNVIHCGDALATLRTMPDNFVHCIITSPPYYALRDYGIDGQAGLEDTPQAYLSNMVAIFREARRVLRNDGVAFVNMGDSYATAGGNRKGNLSGAEANGVRLGGHRPPGFKDKDLMMMPHRLAIALQDDGWWVRSDIVWHKCLSGGATVYAQTQKGEMPMTVKDLVRLDPATVKLWDGDKWNQAVSWKETAPDKDRKRKSGRARSARYRGKDSPIAGDIELELRNGDRIGCTRTHRWPTQRGIVCAADIETGDVIQSTQLPEPQDTRIPSALCDDDIGWLAGLYIAEGSQSQGTIQISSHLNEQSRLERLGRIATEYDGYCYSSQTSENGMTININSPVIRGIIETYVSGTNAKTKHLNMRCWKRSNQFLESLLMGYLEGDGHKVDATRYRVGFTKNDALAQDLRTICARLGYSLRVRRCQHVFNGDTYDGWRGDLVLDVSRRRSPDTEVVAIRQSRARKFYDITLAENPHLFALASGVLTHNSNPMPESVTDRPTKAHEYVFMLTKASRYWYDADAVREAGRNTWNSGGFRNGGEGKYIHDSAFHNGINPLLERTENNSPPTAGRNLRSVWTIATAPYADAHFATFPPALPALCIKAGCPDQTCAVCGRGWERVVETRGGTIGKSWHDHSDDLGLGQRKTKEETPYQRQTLGFKPACDCDTTDTARGITLDPFMGSGTVAVVARALGRDYVGIELNPEYIELAKLRLGQKSRIDHLNSKEAAPLDDLPMFAQEQTA